MVERLVFTGGGPRAVFYEQIVDNFIR